MSNRKRPLLHLLTLALVLMPIGESAFASPSGVEWQGWSDTLFSRAKSEGKLVLLDLEAVWCHWCHVMDQQTYSVPAIASLLHERFIPVKVDQDLRPDLGVRYQEYGWPATIIFNSDGVELVKRAGFMEPEEMLALLQQTVKNPNVPESGTRAQPSRANSSPDLSAELRGELLKKHRASLDRELGALRISQRYLDAETIEYALKRMEDGDAEDREWVKLTLTNNLKLVDPVWGGVYQYSTHRGWDRPHFEKIMSTQTKNLRLYSLAGVLFDSAPFQKAADDTYRYLRTFLLSPEGAFYASQDADVVKGKHSEDYFRLDDAGRRKEGIPAIDRHLYARENGLAIEALVYYANFTDSTEALETAKRAANWIVNHRALPGGGFSHDEKDAGGPYLGDTLAMGSAFVALYEATGERDWLTKAEAAARFIAANFRERHPEVLSAGFISAVVPASSVLRPVRKDEENIRVARFMNLLARYLGKEDLRILAASALQYLNDESIALVGISNSGVLLAAEEYAVEPLHITVVGKKSDPAALALFNAARAQPFIYRRIDWWDRSEGPLPNPDVQYPELPKSAAFVCTSKRCSLPIFAPDQIPKTIERFMVQQ